MKKLKEINRSLDKFFAKTSGFSRENYVLWSVENSRQFKEFEEEFEKAISGHFEDMIKTPGLWEDINKRFGNKDEDSAWDKDDLEDVREIVLKNVKELEEFVNTEKLRKAMTYFAERGGQAFLDKVNLEKVSKRGVLEKKFNAEGEEMQRRIQRRVNETVSLVGDTDKKEIANSIFRGKEEGLAHEDIVKDIREKVPSMSNKRAMRISRTEMGECVNDTEMLTAKKNNASSKTWSAAGPNICDECLENDRRTIQGLDGIFPSGDERPPIHPNCKCLLEYTMPPVEPPEVWRGDPEIDEERVNQALDESYRNAESAKEEIDVFADEVSGKFEGSFVAKAPLKGRARAFEKAVKEKGGNVGGVTDIARNTVVSKNRRQSWDMYDYLRKNPNVIEARMMSTDLGYDGGMIKYRAANGHIAEMQVATAKMIYAKEKNPERIIGKKLTDSIRKETNLPSGKGHEYYEEWRVLDIYKKDKVIEIRGKSRNYYSNFKG